MDSPLIWALLEESPSGGGSHPPTWAFGPMRMEGGKWRPRVRVSTLGRRAPRGPPQLAAASSSLAWRRG